jgi:hypothetical protein
VKAEKCYSNFSGKPEEKRSLEELGIDGIIIILKRHLKKMFVMVWIRVN